MILKRQPIRSRAVRHAAEGEECTVEIPGVCRRDTETTVLAHLPDESHGISRKSDDVIAAFACQHCHAAIDRREYSAELESDREGYLRRAQSRTLRRLWERGIVTVKGAY